MTVQVRTQSGLIWEAHALGDPSRPAAFLYIGLSEDTTTPLTSDTVLAGELTTLGFARALGVFDYTTSDTFFTITASWAAERPADISKAALFNVASGGNPLWELLYDSPFHVDQGDQYTVSMQVNI